MIAKDPLSTNACLIIPEDRRRELVSPQALAELQTLLPRLEVLPVETWTEETFHEELYGKNPEVLLTGWSTPALPPTPPSGLKYICNLTGGVRHFLPRSYLEQGILVTEWGDAISHTVAEMALYGVLHCLRAGTAIHEVMHHQRGWRNDAPQSRSLFNRRLGIHGFGRIARKLVLLLQPFSIEISAYSPPVPDSEFEAMGVRKVHSLEEFFSENEVIVELEGLTPETTGMIQARHLALLPDGAVFVNVGRAGVVDEQAVIGEAVSGRLHFGLDVFWDEPLPPDHPLRGLPNVALYPHIAGATPDQMFCIAERAIENVGRYLRGEPLISPLSPQAFDRMT